MKTEDPAYHFFDIIVIEWMPPGQTINLGGSAEETCGLEGPRQCFFPRISKMVSSDGKNAYTSL